VVAAAGCIYTLTISVDGLFEVNQSISQVHLLQRIALPETWVIQLRLARHINDPALVTQEYGRNREQERSIPGPQAAASEDRMLSREMLLRDKVFNVV
jgi:hypothetical protein